MIAGSTARQSRNFRNPNLTSSRPISRGHPRNGFALRRRMNGFLSSRPRRKAHGFVPSGDGTPTHKRVLLTQDRTGSSPNQRVRLLTHPSRSPVPLLSWFSPAPHLSRNDKQVQDGTEICPWPPSRRSRPPPEVGGTIPPFSGFSCAYNRHSDSCLKDMSFIDSQRGNGHSAAPRFPISIQISIQVRSLLAKTNSAPVRGCQAVR